MSLVMLLSAGLVASQAVVTNSGTALVNTSVFWDSDCAGTRYTFTVGVCEAWNGVSFMATSLGDECGWASKAALKVTYYNESITCGVSGGSNAEDGVLTTEDCLSFGDISLRLDVSADVTEGTFCGLMEALVAQATAQRVTERYTNENCTGECVDECNPKDLLATGNEVAMYEAPACADVCDGFCCEQCATGVYYKALWTCVSSGLVYTRAVYEDSDCNVTRDTESVYYDDTCRELDVAGDLYEKRSLSETYADAVCTLVVAGGIGSIVRGSVFEAEFSDIPFDIELYDLESTAGNPASSLAAPFVLLAGTVALLLA